MKKILFSSMLLFILISLSACKAEEIQEDIIVNEIDYDSLYEEEYSSVEPILTEGELDLCKVGEPGTTMDIEIDYVIMYPKFSDEGSYFYIFG